MRRPQPLDWCGWTFLSIILHAAVVGLLLILWVAAEARSRDAQPADAQLTAGQGLRLAVIEEGD